MANSETRESTNNLKIVMGLLRKQLYNKESTIQAYVIGSWIKNI